MAPRRATADASPSPLRRLRLQADHPLRRHRISRRKVQTPSIKEIRRIEILSEGYVSSTKEETDHEAETETEAETRWERNTRGDARALWVEQLYRYEEFVAKTKADLHARIYMNLHHDFIPKHLAYDYFVHLELILNIYPSKAVDMMNPQLYEGGAAEPLPHSRGAAFQPSE
ncbi:hypothetical protein TsFJ059_003736 [Trichoderma semiorbis]|uniref:Uncharacterized protein n=1 Tax=Trichoderma semiorbis TaxID=1491008 RepID=A0A9P8HH84_9HYPO|nr:hypothetical protein TsFJ059_003736 [Trichoderma semiorbis]